MVDILGVKCEVNVVCIVGDDLLEDLIGIWILIYVGFVMSKINEEEVVLMLEVLCEFGEVQEEIEVMWVSVMMLVDVL